MPVRGNVAWQDITSASGRIRVLIAAIVKPLGLSSKCWELSGVCFCFSARVQFPLCFLAPWRLVRFCGWNVWPGLSCGRVITETVPLNFTLDVAWLPFCNSGTRCLVQGFSSHWLKGVWHPYQTSALKGFRVSHWQSCAQDKQDYAW